MKKILVTVLTLVLGLTLLGCGGSGGGGGSTSTDAASSLDKTFSMADGDISFNVSSDWKESDGLIDSGVREYLFQSGTGMFSVTFYSNTVIDPDQGLAAIKELYADTYKVTNFKDISRNAFSRDGMSIVVFEYSYNDPNDGDTIERLAYITKGNQQVIIFFLNYADRFDPSDFDALLKSFQWK